MAYRIFLAAACILAVSTPAALAADPNVAQPLGASGPTGRGPSGQLLYLISKDLITSVEAQRLVQAAVDSCARRQTPCAAIVIDVNGAERAELSGDQSPLIGWITAGKKAQAVLAFKASTARLAERLNTDNLFADKYAKDDRYFFVGGGVPIFKNGVFVATLAVGGTHNQDEACALEALKSIAWAKTSTTALTAK